MGYFKRWRVTAWWDGYKAVKGAQNCMCHMAFKPKKYSNNEI